MNNGIWNDLEKSFLFWPSGGPRAPSIASTISELFLKAVIVFPPESVAFFKSFFIINDRNDYKGITVKFQGNIKEMLRF